MSLVAEKNHSQIMRLAKEAEVSKMWLDTQNRSQPSEVKWGAQLSA